MGYTAYMDMASHPAAAQWDKDIAAAAPRGAMKRDMRLAVAQWDM